MLGYSEKIVDRIGDILVIEINVGGKTYFPIANNVDYISGDNWTPIGTYNSLEKAIENASSIHVDQKLLRRQNGILL